MKVVVGKLKEAVKNLKVVVVVVEKKEMMVLREEKEDNCYHYYYYLPAQNLLTHSIVFQFQNFVLVDLEHFYKVAC